MVILVTTTQHGGRDRSEGRHSGLTGQLHQLLESAPKLRFLPSDLTPSLTQAGDDWGGPYAPCWPGLHQSSIPDSCVFGDPQGAKTMVIYGDSTPGCGSMRSIRLRKQSHWRLIDLARGLVRQMRCPSQIRRELVRLAAWTSVQSMAHIRHPTDKSAETGSSSDHAGVCAQCEWT